MNEIVLINKETCIGCGRCVNLCPKGILFINDDGIAEVTNENECDKLRGCMRVCPVKSIKIN